MLDKRYDFVFYFDVQDGNPNGDPDAGNMPRIDPETGVGLVTDVCLKRKVRNYVELTHQNAEGYDIFVKERAVLNRAIEAAYDEANPAKDMKTDAASKQKAEDNARKKMCEKFFDIRAFGAVLSTGEKEKDEEEDSGENIAAESSKKKKSVGKKGIAKSAGQVRGPIQLTFSRSEEPVVISEHTITRMAVTNERDLEKERTMGRKYTIPYGLYRANGFVSAHLAEQTGFTEKDLSIFWDALTQMFEHDHSAARGLMSARKLVIFEHSSSLGNAPAHELFERVKCARSTEGPARNFSDYKIIVDGEETKELKKLIKVG